jgi:hypothetical protein
MLPFSRFVRVWVLFFSKYCIRSLLHVSHTQVASLYWMLTWIRLATVSVTSPHSEIVATRCCLQLYLEPKHPYFRFVVVAYLGWSRYAPTRRGAHMLRVPGHGTKVAGRNHSFT